MSNSFRPQPPRRLMGGYFVRRSGVEGAKLAADGFWEQSASQGGSVESACPRVGTGTAPARGATVAAATAGAAGAGAVSGRGVAVIGTALNASGSGSAAGLGATIAVAAISATGAGAITGAAGVVTGTDAAFSIQGAGAVTGRGAAASAPAHRSRALGRLHPGARQQPAQRSARQVSALVPSPAPPGTMVMRRSQLRERPPQVSGAPL